jgi:hypothetical protein
VQFWMAKKSRAEKWGRKLMLRNCKGWLFARHFLP